jgi:fimbrial chaperone protein
VAPISVEVLTPSNTSALTLQNLGTRELRAQIRVFKWKKGTDGSDILEPTSDVVASPPAATLTPKTNYTVRLVRTAKRPITSEESYRVFVDELPDPALQRNGAIGVVLRQSIPVFFAAPDRARPQVEWSLTQTGGQLNLIAANSGGRRVQVSEVALQTQNGRTVTFGRGLLG